MSAVGALIVALVAAPPASESARDRGAGFAFGAFGGLSYTLYPRPSGDVAMYVGVALPGARRRAGRQRFAVGYRGELSFGDAEFAPGNEVHRHHLALMGFAGARQRVLMGGGAGAKVTFAGGVGVEAAVQAGYAVIRREHGSLVVGGQVRVGSWLCEWCGIGSFPQFGVFAGWLRLPSRMVWVRVPTPARTQTERTQPERMQPERVQSERMQPERTPPERSADVAAPLHVVARLQGFAYPEVIHEQTQYKALVPLTIAVQREPRRGVWGGGHLMVSLPLPYYLVVGGHIGYAWPRGGVALDLVGGLTPLVGIGARARVGDLTRSHLRIRAVFPMLPASPRPIGEIAGSLRIPTTDRPLWLTLHFESLVTLLWGTLGVRIGLPRSHGTGAHFIAAGAGVAAEVSAWDSWVSPAFLLGYEYRGLRSAAPR